MLRYFNTNRILILLSTLYFIVHIAILVSGGFQATPNTFLVDEVDYLVSARNLAQTGEYTIWGGQPAFRTPGYSLFLTAIYVIGGGKLMHIQIVQMLLGFISGFLLYRIAMRIVNKNLACLAAALFWFYPTLVIYRSLVFSETLYIAVFIAAVYCLFQPSEFVKQSRAIGGGFFLGMLILVRGEWLPIAAVICLWFLFIKSERRIAFVLAITIFMSLSPWLIRNYFRYGKPVFATMTGYNLWLGNNPDANGSGVVNDNPNAELNRLIASVNTNNPATRDDLRSSEMTNHARAYILSNPGKTIILGLNKLGFLWANEYRILEWAHYWNRIRVGPTVFGILEFLLTFYWPALLLSVLLLCAVSKPAPLDFLFLVPLVSSTIVFLSIGDDRYHLQFLPIVFLALVYGVKKVLIEHEFKPNPWRIIFSIAGIFSSFGLPSKAPRITTLCATYTRTRR
jgi:4-amino-4-deoxy-L-arabinose transferase-like glycosyltransferase